MYKRFHFNKSERSLKKSLEKKGISVIERDEEEEDNEIESGTSEAEINNIVKKLHDLVDAEKKVKKEERKLSRKIEELYIKTRPILEESDVGKESKGKDSKIQNRSQDTSEGKVEHSKKELDDDHKRVLLMTDELLEKLPDEVIDKFVNSEDFETYKKVLEKVKEDK